MGHCKGVEAEVACVPPASYVVLRFSPGLGTGMLSPSGGRDPGLVARPAGNATGELVLLRGQWRNTREDHMHTRTLAVAFGTAAFTLGCAAAPVLAADPPSSWTNERSLVCDGQPVTAYLTPAGFGSAFHLSGSTDVIKP